MLSRSRERDRAQALAVPGAAPQAEGGDHSVACPDAAVTSGPGLRGAGIGTRLRPSSLHCTSFLKEAESQGKNRNGAPPTGGSPVSSHLGCQLGDQPPARGLAASLRDAELCAHHLLWFQLISTRNGRQDPGSQQPSSSGSVCPVLGTRHRGAAWGAAQSPSVCAHWQQAGHHTP